MLLILLIFQRLIDFTPTAARAVVEMRYHGLYSETEFQIGMDHSFFCLFMELTQLQ
jgi:hypothetical protein